MLFNSYIFIFFFLPVCLIGYHLLFRIKKYSLAKLFLVVMSLWFYGYYHLPYLWILLLSIGSNYLFHLGILKSTRKKGILACGILVNIGLLTYFKYFDFLIETMNGLLKQDFSLLKILLPLGISFFTFQQIAFLVDTAKGGVEKQNVLDYALFVSFFPQLSSGPIVSHEEMLPQYRNIAERKISAEKFYNGLRIFVLGLTKKVILADTFGRAVNWGFQYYTVLDGFNTFLVIILYTFQIYLDFSGYSDMTRGIGYMFNIDLPVNFLSPYKSRNIVEFWDRWHMTLTRFFTRYVYIPLGGNRKGKLRTYVNVFIVFFISGVWHGAGFTYIVWGILHGAATVATRLWFSLKKKLNVGVSLGRFRYVLNLISGLATFLFVTFAWTYFRAGTIAQATEMIGRVFTGAWTGVYLELAGFFQLSEFEYVIRLVNLDRSPISGYLGFGLFMAVTAIMIWCCGNIYEKEKDHKPSVIYVIGLVVLTVWCVVSMSQVSSFLYVNF